MQGVSFVDSVYSYGILMTRYLLRRIVTKWMQLADKTYWFLVQNVTVFTRVLFHASYGPHNKKDTNASSQGGSVCDKMGLSLS